MLYLVSKYAKLSLDDRISSIERKIRQKDEFLLVDDITCTDIEEVKGAKILKNPDLFRDIENIRFTRSSIIFQDFAFMSEKCDSFSLDAIAKSGVMTVIYSGMNFPMPLYIQCALLAQDNMIGYKLYQLNIGGRSPYCLLIRISFDRSQSIVVTVFAKSDIDGTTYIAVSNDEKPTEDLDRLGLDCMGVAVRNQRYMFGNFVVMADGIPLVNARDTSNGYFVIDVFTATIRIGDKVDKLFLSNDVISSRYVNSIK